MEKKNSLSGIVVFLLIITVAVLGVYVLFGKDNEIISQVSVIIKNDAVPDNVPVVQWDNDSKEKSCDLLFEYLKDLEPMVAVKDQEENLQWDEICRECFWVDSFNITETEGSSIKRYNFVYRDDAADNKKMQNAVDEEVDDIIALVPKEASDWEKVLVIHDELIRRITYDESDELAHSHDIYGALVERRAVCQGYTYSMTYICQKLGIRCGEIYSGTHIWNKFPDFDSNECYVDVTWDDIDRFDSSGNHYIIHDNFGLSKKDMEKQAEHQPEGEEKSKTKSHSTGDNFYRRKGRYIPNGETEVLELAVKEQLDSGANLIEVRFASDTDFAAAKDTVDEIIRAYGYKESYYSWKNDILRVYSVGLNPPEE